MSEPQPKIQLTEFSRAAGCGCKIAPATLKNILEGAPAFSDSRLLVGNEHHDDAAVLDLGDGTALIATTDFFAPIVDDAFDFGRIAAANAISDVYAMGGKPLVATAILGWPDRLPPTEAKRVMQGARNTCARAGISLAGGHSIESSEPFFGLSVNGLVNHANLKRNHTAVAEDFIYLTKPLGVGIIATAQKRKKITEEDVSFLTSELLKLNTIGEAIGTISEVSAMTDVTGFGLAGHLLEMAEGSGLAAEIFYSCLPIYESAKTYLKEQIIPDATYRNWQAYSGKIEIDKSIDFMEAFGVLPDPQTNGGLLISVSSAGRGKLENAFKEAGLAAFCEPIGRFVSKKEKSLNVKP